MDLCFRYYNVTLFIKWGKIEERVGKDIFKLNKAQIITNRFQIICFDITLLDIRSIKMRCIKSQKIKRERNIYYDIVREISGKTK